MTGAHLATVLDDGAIKAMAEAADAERRGLRHYAEHLRAIGGEMHACAERLRGSGSAIVAGVLFDRLKEFAAVGRYRTTARRFAAALDGQPIGGDTIRDGDLRDRRDRPVRF